MSQRELLKRTVESLRSARVPYMLTGSVASSALGEPRATHGIDIVVKIRPDDADRLARGFPTADYYFDVVAARQAFAAGQMFNVMHYDSGDKVDLWPLGADAFSLESFQRRIEMRLLDLDVSVSSPEDLMLQKLRWAELSGGSERQVRDVVGIVQVQGTSLDFDYIERWVDRLGLRDAWKRVCEQTKGVDDIPF